MTSKAFSAWKTELLHLFILDEMFTSRAPVQSFNNFVRVKLPINTGTFLPDVRHNFTDSYSEKVLLED